MKQVQQLIIFLTWEKDFDILHCALVLAVEKSAESDFFLIFLEIPAVDSTEVKFALSGGLV